jgi:hypothetical protein
MEKELDSFFKDSVRTHGFTIKLKTVNRPRYGTVNKEYRCGKVVSVTTAVVFGSVKEVFRRLKALWA